MIEFERLLLAQYPDLGHQGAAKLRAHFDLLLKWNRVLNLTAIRDPEEVLRRHYLESLFLASRVPPGPQRIADIGSGGGFPGIPVAALRTDCEVTLVESHQRKAVFLKEAARAWSNLRVSAARAEVLTGSYDLLVSRAVRPTDVISLLPRLAPHALLLAGGVPAGSDTLTWYSTPLPDRPDTVLAGTFHVER